VCCLLSTVVLQCRVGAEPKDERARELMRAQRERYGGAGVTTAPMGASSSSMAFMSFPQPTSAAGVARSAALAACGRVAVVSCMSAQHKHAPLPRRAAWLPKHSQMLSLALCPAVPVDMPSVPVSPGPEHVQVSVAIRVYLNLRKAVHSQGWQQG